MEGGANATLFWNDISRGGQANIWIPVKKVEKIYLCIIKQKHEGQNLEKRLKHRKENGRGRETESSII